MTRRAERAAEWMYHGLWRVLVGWFRVPKEPPTLPAREGEYVASFRPAPGFLRYLKFWFWLLLLVVDLGLTVGYLAAAAALVVAGLGWVALLLLPVALFVIIAPDLFAYVAIHLRYDTTWYVMTERSLRIRRGVMVIHETTITFENVQNLKVRQGPLQRHFGIADVVVETAGSGGAQGHQGKAGVSHRGVIEGIDNAPEIRERILSRMRQSATAGLGDEEPAAAPSSAAWTTAHLAALREVREEVRLMCAAARPLAPPTGGTG
jgi:membrane protein YdbS with pleckstrin-like domain